MLFLVGMPGAGKTYWGGQIALAYDWQHVDTDALVEKSLGKTVSQIFEEHGEAAFRDEEQRVLTVIVNTYPQNAVVSCGGGLPLRAENRTLMQQAGCLIYIQGMLTTIAQHLHNKIDRPLLSSGENLINQLEQMYAVRKEIYQDIADYTVSAETLTIKDFQPIIKACTNQP